MDKTLFASLILALISGLTFLAYKHPIAFKRLFWPLFFLITAAFFVATAWNGAVSSVLSALSEFIPPTQLQAASLKAHELDFPSWHTLAFLCSGLYMSFLLWLPILLAEDKEKIKPKDE